MIGTRYSIPGEQALARELALHILWYHPVRIFGDNDVNDIVRNAFSFTQTHQLNPQGFAGFCGRIQEDIDDIRRIVRECNSDSPELSRNDMTTIRELVNQDDFMLNDRLIAAFARGCPDMKSTERKYKSHRSPHDISPEEGPPEGP